MDTKSRSDHPYLSSLQKILELERTKGFKDTAVIGGIDKYLQRRPTGIPEFEGDDAHKRLEAAYSKLALGERQEWIEGWLSRLQADQRLDVEGPSKHRQRPKGPASKPSSDSPGPRVSPSKVADAAKLAPTRPKSRVASPSGLTLDSRVDRLPGVDTKTSTKLDRLGVSTIQDLLHLLPRRHDDFSQVSKISELVPGEEQTVIATVWEARETSLGHKGKLKATEAVLSDETGNIKAVWLGQKYLARVLKPNSTVAISGKVEILKGRQQFQSPEVEIINHNEALIHTARLVPIYPLTAGLTPRKLRTITWKALERWAPSLEEFLPEDVQERVGLVPLVQATEQAHYPDNLTSLEAARKRLAFDELLLLQLGVLLRRKSWQEATVGRPVEADLNVVKGFLASLPFNLTDAQAKCLDEVLADMTRGTPPMNRLLQGDVGSGKTVVALAALLQTATSDYQGSIMVPTEVLAEQHFSTISRLFEGLPRPVQEENHFSVHVDSCPNPVSFGLLTGSTRASVKRELQKRAADGTLDILIGTHALIQGSVEMPNLALAVVDEQHRFGVAQRAALRQKGSTSPHVLIMSATPIPRTLSLTLFGDLDISTIDELPPGRQQVRTRHVPPEQREAAYNFVRKEVQNGRQAFVICPLIEESETIEARAATEEYERLSSQVYPDLRLSLLHGRMGSKEKDAVMRSFRDGHIDILVSTAVVEVGIDVANATVMVVEGAHRFGLSQLHQFRGRVGRGAHKSYCLLLAEYSSSEAEERLSAVERIHDGFELAEVDLRLRGPGDFFGTRQSGLPNLRAARLSDVVLLNEARKEAANLLEDDPTLHDPSHRALAKEVARFLDQTEGEVS